MTLLRQVFSRLRTERPSAKRPDDPVILERILSEIRSHEESHATLFERAERLRSRAERLEKEGTPSDSAGNRAERAEEEVRASLADLRASFASAKDPRGLIAFDLELSRRYPAFKASGSNGS